MRQTLAIAVALVILSACKATPEQEARVRAALPPGCQLHDLGEYGSISNLVIVTCDGRRTTTTLFEERHGKTTHINQSMVIQ